MAVKRPTPAQLRAVAQDLGVHLADDELASFQQYAHLSPEHQRQAVERLARWRTGSVRATDPVTVPAASAVGGGGDVATEKKWWTGRELNPRHRDFQFCQGNRLSPRKYIPPHTFLVQR